MKEPRVRWHGEEGTLAGSVLGKSRGCLLLVGALGRCGQACVWRKEAGVVLLGELCEIASPLSLSNTPALNAGCVQM